MPKPTFFQAVLRKPTRSYADPNGTSPWADTYRDTASETYYDTPSRYTPQIDQGVHLGYKGKSDKYAAGSSQRSEAGPSRPRKVKSTVSLRTEQPEMTLSRPSTSMSTRFPQAKKIAASKIELRETTIIHRYEDGEEKPARAGTVKKKKAKSRQASELGSVRQSAPHAPRAVERHQQGYEDDASSTASSGSNNLPPPFSHRFADSDTSSSRSSPPTTRSTSVAQNHKPVPAEIVAPSSRPRSNSRPTASVIQNTVITSGIAPLTPPSSDMSLATLRRKTQATDQRLPNSGRSKSHHADTINNCANDSADSGRSSGSDPYRTAREAAEHPNEAVSNQDVRTHMHLSAPTFSLQPPTPAPLPDPEYSPFHQNDNEAPSPSKPARDRTVIKSTDSPVFENDDDDAESVHPEVGSDEEAETTGRPPSRITLSRRSSASQPSQAPSRAVSMDLLRSPGAKSGSPAHSRAGSASGGSQRRAMTTGSPSIDGSASQQDAAKRNSRKSFSEFVVHQRRGSTQVSERSYGGNSELSNRNSGYGKGGWAAAAALGPSRSATPTPVMYMPTSPNAGWAEFQVPTGPPRQSKFTPLPPASQPPTFNGILLGEAYEPNSRAEDQAGDDDDDDDDSSLSEYSRLSNGQPIPVPSQSYAHHRPAQGDSRPPSDDSASEHTVDPQETPRPDQYQHGDFTTEEPLQYQDRPDFSRHRRPDVRLTIPAPLGGILPDHSSPHRSSPSHEQYQPPSRPMSPVLDDRNSAYNSYSRPQSETSRPMSPSMAQTYRPPSRAMSVNPYSPADRSLTATPRGFDAPSFLDPDTLTILPEMTTEDSHRTYVSDPRGDAQRRTAAIRRSRSVFGGSTKSAGGGGGASDNEDDEVGELPSRRSRSVLGHRKDKGTDKDNSHRWEGSSAGEGVLMESNGLGQDNSGGYTNLILPSGAYRPVINPSKKSITDLDMRALGLPHATMASLTLSSSTHRVRSDTPAHLRSQLPAPVDFSSHLKPPTKVSDSQLLVQVYAVAVDGIDSKVLDDKSRSDVGKWVPGRSFVGRCLMVGVAEKEIVRGDLVMGLLDVKKSGALSEYIVCDRRRIARTPFPSNLTLEQMSLLPLQGISAIRAIRARLIRHSRAIICDAHQGIPALICQELARAGVHVTALVSGGQDHHAAQSLCMAHGAKGVLTGKPAAVMNGLDEGWDFIVETQGGQNAYDAAKRILKDGGKLITLVAPDPSAPKLETAPRPVSGFKSLRAAFGSKRQNSKSIIYEYLSPAGSGEPEVDSSGEDYRDVLEEPCMSTFRPVVSRLLPFEKGSDAFRGDSGAAPGARGEDGCVIRIIH